jgi:hypothetical protein
LWRKAVGEARALRMPGVEALAEHQIGTHPRPGEPNGSEHLDRARDLCAASGAEYPPQRGLTRITPEH